MRVEIVEPAGSIISKNPRPFLLRSLRWFLRLSEKYFGSPLFVRVPPELYGVDLDLKKAVATAQALNTLGIIPGVRYFGEKYPDEPFLHIYKTLPRTSSSLGGSGGDFIHQEAALWRALGEATERYLWSESKDFYPHLIFATYKEVKEGALDPFSLAGFSDEQKQSTPIFTFDEDTPLGWVQTRSLTEGRTVLCPAQLVSKKYFAENAKTLSDPGKKEPMLRAAVTTGLATGHSFEEAATKGLLEVIERDAFMISYLNMISPPILDLDYLAAQDEELERIFKHIRRHDLEFYLLKLPTDFNVHAICAVAIDRTGKGTALTVGGGANFDLKTALLSALTEAIGLRIVNKPIYRNDYTIPDIHTVTRDTRQKYWMKLEHLPNIAFFTKGAVIRAELPKHFFEPQKDKKYYEEKLATLKKEFAGKGYKAYLFDFTRKDVARHTGFHSVFAVAPELQPLHLSEQLRYMGGKRLREVPQKLGFKAAEHLNEFPQPLP